MAIPRQWTVAIALTIILVGVQARGIPKNVPAAPKTASDLFAKLGLEDLTLEMFPGEEGETVTKTFTKSPGETQTVSVSRSAGGAVSVKTTTQRSSIDGLSTTSPDLLPSQIDFLSAFQSALGTEGATVSGEKVVPEQATPAPSKAKAAPVIKTVAAKASVGKAVVVPKNKKGGKKKKVSKTISKTEKSASEQSAVVVAPLAPLEKESAAGSDLFSLVTKDSDDLFTVTAKKNKEIPGIPVVPSIPISEAALSGAPSKTLEAPKTDVVTPTRSAGEKPTKARKSQEAHVVTPTRGAGDRDVFGTGRVGVEESTRASTSSGPTSDFKASTVSEDGVTATVVSGSSVGSTGPVVETSTGEECSDTETSTAAVERCVNAVRQNPSKYSKLLACDIPVYTPRPPLAVSSHLGVAAAEHARDMASIKVVTHTGSDGSTMGLRIWERAGFLGSPIAENVAGGQRSARAVVFAWMCSEGHRKNIMSCAHDSMGTGLTRNGRVYWAQTFGCTKYNKCVC